MTLNIILYAEPLLKLLSHKSKLLDDDLVEVQKRLKISEESLFQVLEYLKQKELVDYNAPHGSTLGIMGIRVTAKGSEVAANERALIESETRQQIIVNGNTQHIAQVIGNSNVINQTIDNSRVSILKQIIQNDKKILEKKKTSLLDLRDKFNTLKESGENIYDVVKMVGIISAKYVPLFLNFASGALNHNKYAPAGI